MVELNSGGVIDLTRTPGWERITLRAEVLDHTTVYRTATQATLRTTLRNWMLSLRKPTTESMSRFLMEQGVLDFSYSAVGATATMPPAGYDVDHTRIKLGEGEAMFQSARAALQRWEMFRLGWVEAWSPETPIQTGEVVAVMGRAIGLWWLNSCRIVYVVDESGPVSKFGFAYGTLPGHVERGEERFMIEWNRGDNSVWYDILAFSRPNHILIRLGYPLVRRAQKKICTRLSSIHAQGCSIWYLNESRLSFVFERGYRNMVQRPAGCIRMAY